MRSQKSLSYLSTISLALCVEFVTFSLGIPQLRAQPLQISLEFPPTENVGAPPRSISGGTRGDSCIKDSSSLVPLTTSNKDSSSLVALTPSNNVFTTASSNPTLYWYVPQDKAKFAEFVVQDKDNQDREVYKGTVALNNTPGIVKLTIPASVYLQAGKNYRWYFQVICSPLDYSNNPSVEGWLQRTELSDEQKRQLDAAKDPLQQAEVYARAKIWQESLTILAQLRSDRPYDPKIAAAWKELLQSAYLEDSISTAPILECCKVNSVSNNQ